MSIRSLVKQRSWSFATPLLPALLASCTLEVAGIQEGESASSGARQTTPAAATGQGAGGAATSGGPTHPAGRCGVGTIDEISDSFDDNVTNAMLWTSFANGPKEETSAREKDGAVSATSSGKKGLFAGYYQLGNARMLNDCSAFIEVKNPMELPQSISTFFQLIDDSQGDSHVNVYDINYFKGRLYFTITVDGQLMPGMSKDIAYEPGVHRWWRFRESQGTSYMDTSPDGKSDMWTMQLNFKTPTFASKVRVKFGIDTVEMSSGGTAIFDNLNVPPP